MLDELLGFLIKQHVHGGVVTHTTEPTMNAKQTVQISVCT
jgi:hypothetical protein